MANSVVKDAGLKTSDIHEVIIAGGSTKRPLFYDSMREIFPTAEIQKADEPENVLAYGATCN